MHGICEEYSVQFYSRRHGRQRNGGTSAANPSFMAILRDNEHKKYSTAEDLLTRIVNTGWRHCTVYYRFYIDFICNIPLVLKCLFFDLEQPNPP